MRGRRAAARFAGLIESSAVGVAAVEAGKAEVVREQLPPALFPRWAANGGAPTRGFESIPLDHAAVGCALSVCLA